MKHKKFISGVILASGFGRRIGGNKLFLKWGNHSLLYYAMKNAAFSEISELIVVVREEDYEKALDTCITFPVKLQSKIKIVLNSKAGEGMSASLKKGVEACNKESNGVLFLLADQPFFGPEEINRLCFHFRQNNATIIAPSYKNERKNPVIFSLEKHRDELLLLEHDKGARDIIKKYPSQTSLIPFNKEILFGDIDTLEDYEKNQEHLFSWSKFFKDKELISVIGAGGKTSLLWNICEEYKENSLPCLLSTTTKMWNSAPDWIKIEYAETLEQAEEVAEKAEKKEYILLGSNVNEENKLLGVHSGFLNKLKGNYSMPILVEADGAKGKYFKAHTPKEPCIPAKSDLIIAVIGMNIIGKPIINKYFHRPELVDYAICTVPLLFHLLTSEQGYFSKVKDNKPFVVFLNHIESKSAYSHGMQLIRLLKKNRNYCNYKHLQGCILGSNKNNYYQYIPLTAEEGQRQWEF